MSGGVLLAFVKAFSEAWNMKGFSIRP